MRPNLQDRSSFYPGPARKSADRESERLTDVIEAKPSSGGGTVTFEVDGAVPTFTGVPAGLQGFYVASVVQSGVIDMAETILLEDGLGNIPFVTEGFGSTDTNHFGVGTASIIGKLDAGNGAAVFNYANGSASALSHSLVSNQGGYRVGPNFAVSTPYIATSTPTVAVVQGGSASVITLSAPSTHTWLQGVGISDDGNSICAVWTSNNSTGSGTAVIALHNLSGTRISTSASVSIPRTGAIACLVDSGRVAFVLPTSVWAGAANSSSTLIQVASAGVLSKDNVTNNISSDGYIFMNVSNDLYRVRVTTSLVSVWPEVFRRYTGSPATLTASTTPFSMHAISATKLVYGAAIYVNSAATFYPLYSAVVLDGTGANVSDSIFTAYSSAASSAVNVYAVTRQPNGNVVFALKANVTPDYRYLIQVTGP